MAFVAGKMPALLGLEDAGGGAGGGDADGRGTLAAGTVAGVGGAGTVAVDRRVNVAALEKNR